MPKKQNQLTTDPDDVDSVRAKYYIIPYVPFSKENIRLIVGAFVLLVSMSIAGLLTAVLGFHDYFHWFLFLFSVVTLLGIAVVLLQDRLQDRISILISDEGMQFPVSFGPDLLFRRRRTWDDIAHVTVGKLGTANRQFYEYDLERAENRMIIHFRSGGNASIDLSRLSDQGRKHLFINIESKVISYSRSPAARISDGNEFLPPRGMSPPAEEKAKSFTELWEEDMQDQFSATNFVPLEKGAFVRDRSFRVLMQLGSGGLSAVYLVETPEKELRVLKESALPLILDPSIRAKAKELFMREALILQKLSHPQIADVFDYFVEQGRDYLVLEFVPGHSLRQLVRQSGALPEKTVLAYGLQLAEIVEYLHDQEPQVVHRDITPDNIVLREDGKIVLIDFGAANEILGTATGTLIGKQAYIAPEQFKGRAEARSDIYAMGGTIFFLLTGRDPEPLSQSHPRAENSQISEAVDALVAECTEQDPAGRMLSAAMLHDKIEQLLDNGYGAVIKLS